MIRPPDWKPFSIAMPMPSTVPPASFTIEIYPCNAQPFASKSSIIKTLSLELKNFLDTIS